MDTLLILPIVIVVLILLVIFFLGTHYKTASADNALIITGSFLGNSNVFKEADNNNKIKVIRGGGTFVWPIVQKVQRLPLSSFQLDLSTPEVYTKAAVPIAVDATVMIKVGSSIEDIATASEQFLNKDREQMKSETKEVMEGHLREILGSMTVESIYAEREEFNQKVQEVASESLVKMGLVIVSFTLKEIKDDNGYLDSLGRPQIAEAKKKADIATAEAQKETRIKQAEAEQLATQSELERQTEIAESQKTKDIQVAAYKAETDRQNAIAEQAYGLSKAESEKSVREREIDVQIAQQEKNNELAQHQIEYNRRKYQADVVEKQTADTNAMKIKADGDKYIAQQEAEAAAVKTVKQGEAEANAIVAKGSAQADAQTKLAEAMKLYNSAAVLKMYFDILPSLVEASSANLAKVDKVTVFDGLDSFSNKALVNTTKSLSGLNEMTKQTLGIDLEDLWTKFTGKQAPIQQAPVAPKKHELPSEPSMKKVANVIKEKIDENKEAKKKPEEPYNS